MIYDCFIFNNELSLLNLCIEELSSLNVHHVVVQANKTFTGIDKTYMAWLDHRITWVYIEDMPETGNAWEREAHQRNAIMRGLKFAKDEDTIIIRDADEIPRATAVKEFIDKGYDFAALRMDNFWYKFNCLTERQTWVSPRVCTFKYLKETTPDEVRKSGYPNVIENAGWHFSYLGDADYIINKLESFSHVEYNTEPYKNKEEIQKKINEGVSLWGDSKFDFIPIDETFPKYLRENQEEFKSLIQPYENN
jgi:beta-1,4-mannosyl-glycoprotein beta-1,4-N-acetylglucosaminyltransferase